MDLLGELGERERREQVHQIADGGYDEHDAQRPRKQPGFVGEISEGRKPQAKEDLSREGSVVLDFEQKLHERIRSSSAEGGHVRIVGRDSQARELEDRVEADHGDRDCDEDEHRPRDALVHVLQQDVKGHSRYDKEGPVQQVCNDAHPNESGVCDNVPSRRRRIAGNVHLRIDKSFSEAAKNADEQVEDAGDSRDAPW